jgi:hypothetical protein
MNDLIVVEELAEWQRLKALVLDSVSSPITRRVYNMALDEFMAWFQLAPRPGFSKATVSAWRVSLEARGLGSSSIIIRMSAIRKLAVEASDNGLLAPELAAGIARVKSAKSVGIRVGNWLSLRQAQALLSTPDTATVKGMRDRAILARSSGSDQGTAEGNARGRWPRARRNRCSARNDHIQPASIMAPVAQFGPDSDNNPPPAIHLGGKPDLRRSRARSGDLNVAIADCTLLQVPIPVKSHIATFHTCLIESPQSPPNFPQDQHFARLTLFVCNARRLQAIRLLTEGL